MPFYLDVTQIIFPNPYEAGDEEGLIAVGGDLNPDRVYLAYQLGIFPWFNPQDEILWWCLDPRFVLFPENLRISKSMKKVLASQQFTFTQNQCFEEVMRRCMKTKRNYQTDTWISEDLIQSYTKMHQSGKAHSFEAWQGEKLVGGFYGVCVGRVFCGESMFTEVSNASKAAFIHFVLNEEENLDVIDCQTYTEHLESLGAQLISKSDFLDILSQSSQLLEKIKSG